MFNEIKQLVEMHTSNIELFASVKRDSQGNDKGWKKSDRNEWYVRESSMYRQVADLGIKWDTFLDLVYAYRKNISKTVDDSIKFASKED